MQIISLLSILKVCLSVYKGSRFAYYMQLMTLDIRPMGEHDLDAVLMIEVISYPTPWKHEHFRDEIAAQYSWPFVVVVEGDVVGYVCLMSLFEEAQIFNIAVAPSHRGRGLAQLLLEYVFSLALEKGAEFMSLEVRVSNLSAISLYEKFGFSRVGIRAKYYESVEDAVLMEKNLKENL